MEKWNCDNGCDFVGYAGDFFQMASPDGNNLMLVCRDCVYDRYLEDWSVELESDPRYTIYTLGDLTLENGVITKGKQYH
jgi:hypothetical protein